MSYPFNNVVYSTQRAQAIAVICDVICDGHEVSQDQIDALLDDAGRRPNDLIAEMVDEGVPLDIARSTIFWLQNAPILMHAMIVGDDHE